MRGGVAGDERGQRLLEFWPRGVPNNLGPSNKRRNVARLHFETCSDLLLRFRKTFFPTPNLLVEELASAPKGLDRFSGMQRQNSLAEGIYSY